MFMNATRSTPEIQQHAIALAPSTHLSANLDVFAGKSFSPWFGLMNSFIVATGATLGAVYFSALTAFAIIAYRWKAGPAFFAFIVAVMLIPTQITTVGFYQFMYQIHMTNSFWPLIIPAIASPGVVFFMRQYLLATFSIDIVNSGRIDGAGEFRIFNTIILPIMKPAIATQAIFVFVTSWNNFFMPLVLLTDTEKYTMPVMVSLLRGDIYRVQLGAVYLGLAMSVLPLFVIYFALSKYIIAGVALGGVKE
jgi:multiple sugar transport system permease protein